MKHLVSQKNDVIVCINKYNVLRNDSDEVLLKQLDSELLLLLLFIHVKFLLRGIILQKTL